MEALILIFDCLYDPEKSSINFDFRIFYDLFEDNGTQMYQIERIDRHFKSQVILYDAHRQDIGGKSNSSSKSLPSFVKLPDNVFVYYSGHNYFVPQLLKNYNSAYEKRLQSASVEESRRFIGVGAEYRDILLAICLFQHPENRARKYIWEKLRIKNAPDYVLVTLHRPNFAKGREIEEFDPRTHFWGIKGITRDFIERLIKCIKGEFKHSDIYKKDNDNYFFHLDVALFQKEMEGSSPIELFRSFDNLLSLGMRPNVQFSVDYDDGRNDVFDHCSDGQIQSIYIYALAEILKDTGGNYITLLDEPDAFLHPEWQLSFLDQIAEIAVSGTENNHILMTTHSAATIAPAKQPIINLFEFDGNKVVSNTANKLDVIKSLSAGMITFSENEARMSINNYIESSDGPVLFTEGITDEIILEEAWKRLYGQQRPFGIQNAFDHAFLRNMLTRADLRRKSRDREVFALFDFDEAYHSWASFNNGITVVEADPHNGLVNQLPYEHHYVMLLPVSRDETIRNQVLNENGEPWAKHGITSYLSIELMFYGIDGLDRHFITKNVCGGGNVIVFAGDKVKFAENIVPRLDDEAFEIFRPMFETIRKIIQPI